MADKSQIEWTDASWNPLAAFDRVTGRRGWFCTKVSEGCRNCYAESFNRYRGNGYEYTAQNLSSVRFDLINLDQPFRWKRPRRIFVNSMTDLFGDFITDEDIAEIFKVMYKAPRHIFQVLTKRPERMLDWISRSAFLSNAPIENTWLGVSVEDQKTADERIPLLIETPAAVRWISAEPLLGATDITDWLGWKEKLDWVVVGGESGRNARPMHPDWVRSLRDQCVAAGVPFFFKQWGEWAPIGPIYCDVDTREHLAALEVGDGSFDGDDPKECHLTRGGYLTRARFDGQPALGTWAMRRAGKKNTGRLLDGREWNEYPSDNLNLKSQISQEAAA